ncbi:hypothetical protein MRB53_041365 [Persea americana]|nr:hypothetical protein MRB53_041365 [Persea americana]
MFCCSGLVLRESRVLGSCRVPRLHQLSPQQRIMQCPDNHTSMPLLRKRKSDISYSPRKKQKAASTGVKSPKKPKKAEAEVYYEAEKIVAERQTERGVEILIQWQGIDPATGTSFADTWVASTHLSSRSRNRLIINSSSESIWCSCMEYCTQPLPFRLEHGRQALDEDSLHSLQVEPSSPLPSQLNPLVSILVGAGAENPEEFDRFSALPPQESQPSGTHHDRALPPSSPALRSSPFSGSGTASSRSP